MSQMIEPPKPGPRAKRHLRVVQETETPKGETPNTEAPKGRKTKSRSAADPLTGLTQKQEAFVQGVMRGLSLSDAYREAYVIDNMLPATIHTRACLLMQDVKVRARCEAIAREREAERRMLASSDAALALEVLRKMALSADTDASKIRAAELLAKAGGVFIDKVEVEDKTPATSVDLERRIAERLARLGIAAAS